MADVFFHEQGATGKWLRPEGTLLLPGARRVEGFQNVGGGSLGRGSSSCIDQLLSSTVGVKTPVPLHRACGNHKSPGVGLVQRHIGIVSFSAR